MKLQFDELSIIYGGLAAGKPVTLPPPRMQYGDFAEQQAKRRSPGTQASDLDFWTHTLDGMAELDLPTDALRTELPRHEGAAFHLPVSEALAHLNMIPLRTRLSRTLTFRDLVTSVRTVTLDAYAHQSLPFERLVEELSPERRLDRDPIISAMVNFIPAAWRSLSLGGLPVECLELPNSPARLPIELYICEGEGRLDLRLVCQRALFRHETMESLLEQYVSLLEQVVADPDRLLTEHSLLTPTAREVLPDPTLPLGKPHQDRVAERFFAWVERSPDATALRQADCVWSYRQVDGTARSIARRLGAHGVRPGDVVAIHGRAGLELVASILAVWQCGGVILTIDPDLPTLRIELMRREAGAQYVLSWDEGKPGTISLSEAHAFRAEATTVALGADPGVDEPRHPDPEDAAYIFFTSGTTGTPKGVLGTHGGLGHFLGWQQRAFSITPGDRIAQLAGLSFDVLLRDLFLPLTSGATLCIPVGADRTEPARVVPWLVREQITHLHAVPSLAQFWLDSAGSAEEGLGHTIRQVFFAGEPLSDQLVRRWRTTFPGSAASNLYGPTETTLAKCCYRIPEDVPAGVQPLGSPLPQTQALVLTPENQLCGIGEAGEIVIRTPFRTRGYLDGRDDAQPCFAPNPFGSHPDDVVYRTGDRGRYRPDGTLEILGRVDDQVKIHGVRIEPYEIATTLGTHPSVRACFVMARREEEGEHTLVAYVVPAREEDRDTAALRKHLGTRLPAAMLPNAIVYLSELALTPNGKIDHAALPAPSLQADPEVEFVAPATDLEKQIVAVWTEVLGVDRIGAHSDFFELGGHSIAALRVINRLQGHLQLTVSVRMVFEAPTVAALAGLIREVARNRDRP